MFGKSLSGALICAIVLAPAQAKDIDDARVAADAGDYDTAFEILTPLAEAQDAEAEHAIGLFYFYALGVEQDYEEAAKWFRKSAEQGYAEGQSALGLMYASGWGVEQDYNQAREWLRKAVNQGLAEAQAELGLMYLQGYGVTQDYDEALQLFRAAADQGNTKAQVSLATMYRGGLGVEADSDEALRWNRIAAESGDPVAQHNMGASYATGHGVPFDYGEAMSWYRKAADQGYAESQYMIGWMYEHGEGVAPDNEEAMRWYALAAEQGHPGAKSRLTSDAGEGPELPTQVLEAIELAKKYLTTKVALEVAVPYAEMGATVHMGDMTISKENVRQYKKDFKRQLKTHRDEIRRRGYPEIAGTYTSETTESCSRIRSSMGDLQGGDVTHVEITQDGFEIEVVLVFAVDGKEFRLSNSAVIVEQGMVMVDELNTDYYFWGVVDDGNITIAPDPGVLAAWPEWAGPPKREDLEGCTIILRPTETPAAN
jgi:TPR repeat protein